MIRTLKTMNIGGTNIDIAVDDTTPLFRVENISYMIFPPKILKTCVYFYIREKSGIEYRPLVKMKLKLTGNLYYIPENELEIMGEVDYVKHQLTDVRYRFCVERGGYYKLFFSDIRKNEWKELDDRIFILGQIVHTRLKYIGLGWPPINAGISQRVYFNVYNMDELLINDIVMPDNFLYSSYGYAEGTLNSMFYLDIETNSTQKEGLYDIIFIMNDNSEFKASVYVKENK